MSESIFETFTDERGNISVRISQEVQVLTREEANRIEAEYRRMQAENAELRKERDFYCNQVIENGGRAQRAIDALNDDNAKLRELAARAWRLFTENGAVHSSDLPEVDAVRNGLRELGVKVDLINE